MRNPRHEIHTTARWSSPAKLFVTALLMTCPLAAQGAEPLLAANKLFDPQHLVDVQIELPASDWEALRRQSRNMISGLGATPMESPFTYFKGDVLIDGVLIENVGIRKKGFLGSLSSDRPSLKIKFDEYVDQSPAKGFDRITLNNNKQDRSVASQLLSYQIFNRTGTPAPRCNLATVIVNSEHLGIYSHVESIRPPFLERCFGNSSGDLYEGTIADFFVDRIDRFELKNGRTDRRHLDRLAAILAEEELNLAKLRRVLDIEAFLNYWATESLIGFWDGYTNNQNNYFVYRKPADGKLRFIPWGADDSFTARMPLPPFDIATKSAHSISLLAHKLYQHPETRKLYRETIGNLLAQHWDEDRLHDALDRIEDLVAGHLHSSQGDFRNAVSRVRNFIETRRDVLNKELSNWPIEFPDAPRQPFHFKKIGTVTATFSTHWAERSPSEPLEVGSAELTLMLDGKRVALTRVGVSAEPSKLPGSRGSRPPTIVFTAERESDGEILTISASLSGADFKPSGKKGKSVSGLFMEGRLGFFSPGGIKTLSGTVRLDAAGMEPGDPVKGSVQLNLMKMGSGIFGRGRRR